MRWNLFGKALVDTCSDLAGLNFEVKRTHQYPADCSVKVHVIQREVPSNQLDF